MHEMCEAALAGNEVLAKQINSRLSSLHQVLFAESNPIPVKWALNHMGMIDTGIRLPMTPLSERYHQPVHEALVAAGVIN